MLNRDYLAKEKASTSKNPVYSRRTERIVRRSRMIREEQSAALKPATVFRPAAVSAPVDRRATRESQSAALKGAIPLLDREMQDILTPEAYQQFKDEGVEFVRTKYGEQPGVPPFGGWLGLPKVVNIPAGTTPNDIRHELFHAAGYYAPNLLPDFVRPESIGRPGPAAILGSILNNNPWDSPAFFDWSKQTESGAISFGGADTYKDFIPQYSPWMFGNLFNMKSDTWNYGGRGAGVYRSQWQRDPSLPMSPYNYPGQR